jgi:hypothetical protein
MIRYALQHCCYLSKQGRQRCMSGHRNHYVGITLTSWRLCGTQRRLRCTRPPSYSSSLSLLPVASSSVRYTDNPIVSHQSTIVFSRVCAVLLLRTTFRAFECVCGGHMAATRLGLARSRQALLSPDNARCRPFHASTNASCLVSHNVARSRRSHRGRLPCRVTSRSSAGAPAISPAPGGLGWLTNPANQVPADELHREAGE